MMQTKGNTEMTELTQVAVTHPEGNIVPLRFTSKAAAEAAVKQLNKIKGLSAKVEGRVTKNLLNQSGPDLIVPYGTPLCCDPSSETYHSM